MFSKYKERSYVVVDSFYENPDSVRDFAYQQHFDYNENFYKGMRTPKTFLFEGLKEQFESLLGEKITTWNEHRFNGCFQVTSAENPQVYHCDQNSWAGIIYLSPDAPSESGTCLYRSNLTGQTDSSQNFNETFSGGFYDSTKFEKIDSIGNVYNRLVLFRGTRIHAAGPYFGTNLGNGRLVHLFFFDTQPR